ncbi:transposase [Geotalea uraniireducens]|uniref:transposase n=1 Tax=Geotalea uraniireducens TaxID=351604 RepID=UPI00006B6CD3
MLSSSTSRNGVTNKPKVLLTRKSRLRASKRDCGSCSSTPKTVTSTGSSPTCTTRRPTSLQSFIIAELYKQRWQIELFFKWIKQNLKVKTFLGTSENAVQTQLWIAMCVYLLLAWLKFKSKLGLSAQQMLRLLQLNLFARRNLEHLFRPPQITPNPQLALL